MRSHNAAVYGQLHARTMADNKAVPMNPMHDSTEVTDNSYAPMLSSDVQERILESYLNRLSRENMKHSLVFIAGRLTQCPLKP